MFGFGLEGVLAARGSRGSIVVFGPVPFMRKESSASHGLRFRAVYGMLEKSVILESRSLKSFHAPI